MVTSNSITITVAAVLVPTTITLAASATSITAGGSVTFSGTVLDQNGNPVSNDTVTLTDSTTGASLTTSTNSSGAYSFSVSFPNAGTFVVYSSG
jgi:type 1 fimbria pilin